MKSKDRIVIQKLIEYTKDIGNYIENLNFETFMNDKKTISACAFTIGQIGELVNNIDFSTQELYPQIPWRGIRGMRNRIVHNYENVDLVVLWSTISKNIPEFKEQLNKILSLESQEIADSEEIQETEFK